MRRQVALLGLVLAVCAFVMSFGMSGQGGGASAPGPMETPGAPVSASPTPQNPWRLIYHPWKSSPGEGQLEDPERPRMLHIAMVVETSFELRFREGAEVPHRAPDLLLFRNDKLVKTLKGYPLYDEDRRTGKRGRLIRYDYRWLGSTSYPDGGYEARVSAPEGQARLDFRLEYHERTRLKRERALEGMEQDRTR